jgi:hypothetical protein
MLPAIGAASLALDAIQSLTSPQPSSKSDGFDALSDLGDSSSGSSAASTTVSGFSSAQISADNVNALLDAQGLSSAGLPDAPDRSNSASDPSQSQSASSAYNAANQLTQSTAIPLGLAAVSISV